MSKEKETGVHQMAATANNNRCNRLNVTESLLRFGAFLCCAVSLVALATDKQRKVIQIPGFNDLSVTKTAKFTIANAFVYLVSAAGIGSGYALLVLLSSLVLKERPSGGATIARLIFAFDQLVTYVLLAAASASAEVAYMGAHAPPELSWLKICTLFGRFCNQLGVSLITSFIATLLFASVAAISACHAFSKSVSDHGAHEHSSYTCPHKA